MRFFSGTRSPFLRVLVSKGGQSQFALATPTVLTHPVTPARRGFGSWPGVGRNTGFATWSVSRSTAWSLTSAIVDAGRRERYTISYDATLPRLAVRPLADHRGRRVRAAKVPQPGRLLDLLRNRELALTTRNGFGSGAGIAARVPQSRLTVLREGRAGAGAGRSRFAELVTCGTAVLTFSAFVTGWNPLSGSNCPVDKLNDERTRGDETVRTKSDQGPAVEATQKEG